MSDLISREDLLERILYEKATTKNMYPKKHFTVNDCITDIKYAPSVDAVEVVRCKDCKHWEHRIGASGACKRFSFEDYTNWTSEDDFCSYGERKEVSE